MEVQPSEHHADEKLRDVEEGKMGNVHGPVSARLVCQEEPNSDRSHRRKPGDAQNTVGIALHRLQKGRRDEREGEIKERFHGERPRGRVPNNIQVWHPGLR